MLAPSIFRPVKKKKKKKKEKKSPLTLGSDVQDFLFFMLLNHTSHIRVIRDGGGVGGSGYL